MGLLRAYPAQDARPLGGHLLLVSVFGGGAAAAAYAQRRSGQPLPERFPASDLALMSIATYKVSRLISKDRITSFIRTPFTRYKGESERALYLRDQRLARTVAALFTIVSGSDLLQEAWVAVDKRA